VETESHKRLILSVVDMATKFCEAVSLKFCNSQSVAEAQFEIFMHFGLCKRIHSDRGPCFVSRLNSSTKCLESKYRRVQDIGLVETECASAIIKR